MDFFGRNLDAVLGITAYPNILGAFAKGPIGAGQFFYRSDWRDEELRNPPGDRTATVQHQPNGRATVHIDLEPSGMAILV